MGSADLGGHREYPALLPYLLDPSQSQVARPRRAPYRNRDRPFMGTGKDAVHCGAAVDGSSIRIRTVLRLGEPDVVGIRNRPAPAGGGPLLRFAPYPPSR